MASPTESAVRLDSAEGNTPEPVFRKSQRIVVADAADDGCVGVPVRRTLRVKSGISQSGSSGSQMAEFNAGGTAGIVENVSRPGVCNKYSGAGFYLP
ncbi:MAG: hypothetical protein LUC94_00460 [Clostridiales bacterium]|nr:hypothetical protein [Clostridiales bacterium]